MKFKCPDKNPPTAVLTRYLNVPTLKGYAVGFLWSSRNLHGSSHAGNVFLDFTM
jgi:hypothetical protein